MELEELPSYELLIDPARWLFVQICLNADVFFAGLQRFLANAYPAVTNLPSVVDYQRELMILPSYDRRRGKSFATDLDWVSYFARARGVDTSERLAEPEPALGAVILANDQTASSGVHSHPLDWDTIEGEARQVRWLHSMVLGRNAAQRNNFQELQVRHAEKSLWQRMRPLGSAFDRRKVQTASH
jgi:putative methyltransferase